ncbi:MAG TPA: glycosyltransferase family 4 protein [Chthoniobacteraceae bacterium]|jgi:UDP-glucose:(heptosyl)LPS alpha-1,3-glucosyltransferase|nr:glycosyltransferase family 4 protein [Chthoniobacteraceae bacterium]
MKIGLVRRGYSATGGAEAYLLRLAGALGRVGHEIILYSDCTWPKDALLQPDIEFRQVAWEVVGAKNFADTFQQLAPEQGCDFILSLERIWKCDAYRAGDGVHADWLERRAEFEPRWRAMFRGFNTKHRQLLALERALFTGGAQHVIANSNMVREAIVRRFGFPREYIDVIYNGVPGLSLAPDMRANVRCELGLADDEFVALFAGSGWQRKGLRFAIEATNAARLSRATLLVAGRGERGSLPRSERVRFLGPVREMPRLFAAADTFILPTIYDPFSNACLEALAAGLPVITTMHNGFGEIIERGVEGEVLADSREIDALARALEKWSDPERRAAVRARLLEKGARFSIEENVRATLAIVEKARESAASA